MCKPLGVGTWIYIWNFRAHPLNFAYGHAALFVRDKRGREAYISWWPRPNTELPVSEGGHRRIPDPKIPYAYDAQAVAHRSYRRDVDIEEQEADHSFKIKGLDEEKIIDYFEDLTLLKDGVQHSGPILPWSAKYNNCSTVVYNALLAGGANKYSNVYLFSTLWTPNRVHEYAKDVKHKIEISSSNPFNE
ncbi:hypothetical protein [Metapseudomonas otitidis]|uniref:hypothetical protein n=1 Tax=Metapseudomonas otitidis TaxID=319939 RepID=UPI0013F5C6DD|nr:hypothetical protein [Pseudomonas otitidis]